MAKEYLTKQISFKDDYRDEYNYLNELSKKGLASQYVCDLIRADRSSKKELAGMNEDKIETIVVRLLGEFGLLSGKILPTRDYINEDIDISVALDAQDLLGD